MADNSSRKFKFISPGVFVAEIDNSQLPATPSAVGPLIIGRSRKGPANKPVRVDSYSDFVQAFGNPVAGTEGGDVWRDGDRNAPTYAAYAAKAWLANNSPLTFIRVLGDQASNAEAGVGDAGWKLDATEGDAEFQGGSYALVVWPSGSGLRGVTGLANTQTGSVAAIFYCQDSRIVISGTEFNQSTSARGSTLYEIADLDSIRLRFTGSFGAKDEVVSLRESQPNFIRRVLNTDPSITNSNITNSETRTFYQGGKYFLGESFENRLSLSSSTSYGLLSTAENGKYWAAILPMVEKTGASVYGSDQANFLGEARKASTGWFFSQDLGNNPASFDVTNMQKLFRIEALTAGENFNREVKISISNLKAGQGDFQPYGSFSLLVRDLRDTDNNQIILERYDNLNLNPSSVNYIAAQIGDRYQTYNKATKRDEEYGAFDNRSNYIRVVMNDDVAAGIGETRLLPFGVFGPPKYREVDIQSGSFYFRSFGTAPAGALTTAPQAQTRTLFTGGGSGSFGLDGHYKDNRPGTDANNLILSMGHTPRAGSTLGIDAGWSGSIRYPGVPVRSVSTQGSPRSLKNTFWGAWTGRSFTDTTFSYEMVDYLRPRNFTFGGTTVFDDTLDIDGATTQSGSSPLVLAYAFTLDDVNGTLDGSSLSGTAQYDFGSRNSSDSISATYGYTGTLDAGLDRFTTVLAGGTDGYNKAEREPFSNVNALSGKTEENSYALFSLRKAINQIADPEVVQMNAISIPGVWAPEVTNYLMDTAEDRGDALAIVDVQYGYTPSAETTSSPADANSANTPAKAASTLLQRNINNSYGAAYYPWVRILDTNLNQPLWAPPSIAALGVLSNTDALQAPWFAPAGFTRGGLSDGAAGIPVLDVSRRLTSDQRDTLYESNINPIAKFPAEGIVVFGQKTLQQTASALDRINVRRLMIYLKREISFIASRLLFGPNTEATWDRFKGQATPLLDSVQAEYGIEDFRLILDETTTTPDLIDRNIIYAKLLVKPTRAVEYFAIDFVVTNSGASFED